MESDHISTKLSCWKKRIAMISRGTAFFVICLSLLLIVNESAMPTETDAVTVVEILQNHALYNRKQVAVRGKATKVQQGRSRLGVEATIFDLVDENSGTSISVVCQPGKTKVQESSVVTVQGIYYEESLLLGIYYGEPPESAGTKSRIDAIEATAIITEPQP
jgi:hypothetical protein